MQVSYSTKRLRSNFQVGNWSLTRWRVPLLFGWKLALHRIRPKGAYGQWHSHDRWMVSVCLWGHYTEQVYEHGAVRNIHCGPWTWRVRHPSELHRVGGRGALTLVLTAPPTGETMVYPHGPGGHGEALVKCR